MKADPDEELRRAPDTLEGVLEFYFDELIPALAAALTIDDDFPEEVLNEVRNAFTHLACANSCAANSDECKDELSAAMRHLRRSCLDCLKDCVSVTARRCEIAVEALTEEVALPGDVYKRMSALRAARKSISADEGHRPTLETIEKMKIVLNDYDEFYVSLDDQFAGDTAEIRKKARRKKQWRKTFRDLLIGFLLGMATSVLGAWLYDKYLNTDVPPPPAANNPSTPG